MKFGKPPEMALRWIDKEPSPVENTEGNMKLNQNKSGPSSPVARWLTLVCLLLVLSSAAAQAMHFHPDGPATDSKHCRVCQVLHSGVAVHTSCGFEIGIHATDIPHLFTDVQHKPSLQTHSLFSRPPPSA
jgi:hypothetical protein